MRGGTAVVLTFAALALVPAGSPGQVAGGEKGCSTKAQRAHGNFSAKLKPKWDGHKPRHWRRIFERDRRKRAWDAIWPIKVTVRRNGRAISGRVYYQFVAFGRVVACRTVKKPYKPRFSNGVFRDRIEFPERSVGIPLTFRVVVRTKYGLKNVNYKVTVQRRKK
jgi:hypothetical protein